MFIKLFANENKRVLKSPVFYICAGAILVITLLFSINTSNNNKVQPSENMIYGIEKYSSFEELSIRLDENKALLDKEVKTFEEGLSINLFTKEQIQLRKANIEYLQQIVIVEEYLFENNIEFNHATSYKSHFTESANSVLNEYLILVGIFLAIIAVFRISIAIPNEIKDGQSKLMLTLPVSRSKYVVYKGLIYFLQSIMFLLAYTLIALIITVVFFNPNGLLIFATNKTVFALSILSAALLQYFFSSILILGVSIVTLGISLLILNKIGSLFLSLIICFGGKPFELIESMFSNTSKISSFFVSSNFNIARKFEKLTANAWWVSLLILFAYCIVLIFVALFKFNRQDIKN